MLLNARVDEYLVATTDNRWHLENKLILLDPDILTEDEQEFCPDVDLDESDSPVAAVTLYHVGEEFQAIACRVRRAPDDLSEQMIWFVPIEEAQELVSIFENQVLLETLRLDQNKANQMAMASTAPTELLEQRPVVELFVDRAELRQALLAG